MVVGVRQGEHQGWAKMLFFWVNGVGLGLFGGLRGILYEFKMCKFIAEILNWRSWGGGGFVK